MAREWRKLGAKLTKKIVCPPVVFFQPTVLSLLSLSPPCFSRYHPSTTVNNHNTTPSINPSPRQRQKPPPLISPSPFPLQTSSSSCTIRTQPPATSAPLWATSTSILGQTSDDSRNPCARWAPFSLSSPPSACRTWNNLRPATANFYQHMQSDWTCFGPA